MAELPLVSVVMPVRNEGAFIDESLGAVVAQDWPPGRLEVLVVDGCSDDDTRERVARLAAQHPEVSIELVDNPRKIAATALNLGIAKARGEVVVRVDGHCVIAPDYVRRGVAVLETDPGVACVGGPLETVGQGPWAAAIAAAMSSRFGVGGSTFRVGSETACDVDTVAFPVFRRAALAAAGPFDEELVRNQDDEYSFRLRKLGWRVRLDPALRAVYYSRSRPSRLARQYLEYGFWKVRVLQKHPAQMSSRQLVPAVLVLAIAAACLMAPWSVAPLLGLVLLYGSACGLAALSAGARSGGGTVLRLMGTFPILHLTYGVGFVAGLVRFVGRWRTP